MGQRILSVRCGDSGSCGEQTLRLRLGPIGGHRGCWEPPGGAQILLLSGGPEMRWQLR